MFRLLGAAPTEIFKSLLNFLEELGKILEWEYILYIGVGLIVIGSLLSLWRSLYTYEMRMLHTLQRLNKYFRQNPYINDDNLIYVNDMFKRVPRNLRYAWQQYMLNRDQLPSYYMNTNTCLDQPLKASSHSNTAKILNLYTYIVAVLTFVMGFTKFAFMDGMESQPITVFMYSMIIPAIVLVVGLIFVMILRSRYVAIVADDYSEFHEFESYINKACTTLNSFIDYEVLFTKKEIKDGIPVLQEYLEKRALQEQKEREEKEMLSGTFESYNFDELGVENSLLIERAMVESEKYFTIKSTMSERISGKEQEMFNYQKNFDEVTKEFERKAQAIRENLKQLNEQLNNTSVNIEANYIRKRYKEDQQRLQQLEKDYEVASIRFNKQQNELQAEIDSYKKEIADKKAILEKAMTEEGRTYANKVFGLINDKVTEQNKPIIEQQRVDMESLKAQIEDLDVRVREKENLIIDLDEKNKQVTAQLETKKAELEGIKNLKEYLNSAEFRQRISDKKKRRPDDGEVFDNMELESLKSRAELAEEQLRQSEEQRKQLQIQENSLVAKLRSLEENEQKLRSENQKLQADINEANNDKISQVQNELEQLNRRIGVENENIAQKQAELNSKLQTTIDTVENKLTSKKRADFNSLIQKAEKVSTSKKKISTKKN